MLVTGLPASFKPEQRRAYTAFSSNYAKRDTRVRLEGVSFVSGEANFFNNHVAVRNVPIADGYSWTQTQAKKEILVPDSTASVSFWKVISRRKDHALSEIPPHKLWMFHISNPEEPPYSMIWCEKGFASDLRNSLEAVFASPLAPAAAEAISETCESYLDSLLRDGSLGPQ